MESFTELDTWTLIGLHADRVIDSLNMRGGDKVLRPPPCPPKAPEAEAPG